MVTHAVKGKTVSKAIPSGPAVERTRAQLAEYQRFRELSRDLVATNADLRCPVGRVRGRILLGP
jgi:hypothetical protein